MKTLHIVDYLIIILALVSSMGVGMYFGRKGQKSTGKYFKAEGKIPAWAIGMSIMATLVSSITFLAYPGEAFSTNWIRLVQGLMVPVVLVFLIWAVVPLYRDVIGLSAYEYFERRFGYFARFYSSVGFLLVHFSKMGTVFYLLSMALSKMGGFDMITTIWVLGAIIVFITLLGGIEGVIWLDVVLGGILISGGVIAFLIIIFSTNGGPVEVWNIAMKHGKIGVGPFDWDFVHLTFWVMAINGIFYAIQKYGTDQTIVQRYLAAKSDKDAIKASLIGVCLSVPVWTLFMFIGTALFSFYNSGGSVLPAGTPADGVFPYFIINELPVGLVGIILAALISAAVSALASDINSIAAVGVEDYYRRITPNATDKQRLLIGKIIVVVSGIVAVSIGTVFVSVGGKGILGIIFNLYAIFSGGIAGIFLLGLFVNRVGSKAMYTGLVACVLFTAYAVLTSTKIGNSNAEKLILDLGDYNFTHHQYMLGVYSHFVLMSVAYAASFIIKEKRAEDNLTIHAWINARKARKEILKK